MGTGLLFNKRDVRVCVSALLVGIHLVRVEFGRSSLVRPIHPHPVSVHTQSKLMLEALIGSNVLRKKEVHT